MRSMMLIGGLLVILAAFLALQTGCETLNMSKSEHQHLYERDVYHDVRTLPDDIDLLFMLDRPTRLSRWLVTY